MSHIQLQSITVEYLIAQYLEIESHEDRKLIANKLFELLNWNFRLTDPIVDNHFLTAIITSIQEGKSRLEIADDFKLYAHGSDIDSHEEYIHFYIHQHLSNDTPM